MSDNNEQQVSNDVDWSRVCGAPECQRFPNRCDHVAVSDAALMVPAVDDGLDLAPDDAGYEHIARMFAESMISDVRKARQAPAKEILATLLQTVAYLARRADGAARVERIVAAVKR